MQEHLHVGRLTWQRAVRNWAILLVSIALPYLLGLHWREFTGRDESSGRKWVQYDGFGPTEYYNYNARKTLPLFILIPVGFRHSNIYGMTRLNEQP